VNFPVYLAHRFFETWLGRILFSIIAIPVLVVALPFIIVWASWGWVCMVHDEWKEFSKEENDA
jgi:hypothetical protein